jgi:hypothetical protein
MNEKMMTIRKRASTSKLFTCKIKEKEGQMRRNIILLFIPTQDQHNKK